MKLLNITVRNIVGLVVIIALAATMFLLIRGRFQSQLAAQANTPIPSATHTPLPTATPSPTVTNTPVLATFTPSLTPPPLVNFDTPAPGPTYTPTPEASTTPKFVAFSNQAQGIKILDEQQITDGSSNNNDGCEVDYYSYISWSPDSQFLLAARPSGKTIDSENVSLVISDMWRYSINEKQWKMIIPNGGVGLWSPNGMRILYSIIQDTKMKSVFVADWNGADIQLIGLSRRGYPISWLDDNHILYFSNDELWKVYTLQDEVSLQNEMQSLVNQIQALPLDIQQIQIASNPEWISYKQGNNLMISNQVDSVVTPLANQVSTSYQAVRWSPDSKQLAYITNSDDGSNGIWVYDTENDLNIQIFQDSKEIDRITWFPDNQSLLFEQYYGGGIFSTQLINTEGSGLQTLLQASPSSPYLAPNGQKIAFFRGCDLWLATLSYAD
ncbi:MAG: hypothetical protein GY797_08050 [Deltaproteobacteria bacterium]|nr:hypothetical protein [Deltaproteobacteria bacterium]